MQVLSTTIEYRGAPIKIEGGNVYAQAFGTTITNHSMHWSWIRLDIDNLPELKAFLQKEGFLL